MPLVTIVIPAYQAARFIGRALEGVRAQTHTEWEVIVVEDGSDDGTAEIVREFGAGGRQPVRYENNLANLGVSATRNRALAIASGEVIAFLDADDWWTPGHLASGLRTLEAGADICCSGFHIYEEEPGKVTETVIPESALFRDSLASLFQCNFIQTSSLVMVRRAAARDSGGFDGTLKVGEDCDYWMRIISRGHRLACTGEASCYYVKHPQSAMTKSVMVAEHGVLFYRKHLRSEYLPLSLRKSAYARALWIYGRMIQRADPERAVNQFMQAWRFRPLQIRYALFAFRAWLISVLSRD